MQSMADMLSAPGGSQQKCTGIALAEVTAIKDPKNHGRVKCRYLTADKDLGETGWIYCLTPFGGKEYGCFFHPGIGDIVALAYEDGDVHRPFVIGSLWAKKNTPPASVSEGKNETFKLITPKKSYVEFSDAPKKEHIPAYTEAEVVVLKRNVVLEQHTYLGVNSVLSGYVCAEADAGSITGDIILGGNNDEQQ